MAANNPKKNIGSVEHGDQARAASRSGNKTGGSRSSSKGGTPATEGETPKLHVNKNNESGKGSGDR